MSKYTVFGTPRIEDIPISNFPKVFLICAVCCFILYMAWSRPYKRQTNEQIIQKACNNLVVAPSLSNPVFKQSIKYILLWTTKVSIPFFYFGTGQNAFIQNRCEFTNCHVTGLKRYFKGDLTKFDAVFFSGRNLRHVTASQLPQQRSRHQIYVFLNIESSSNQPMCNPWWDNFFNWTSTYKLNSDIMYPYIYIRDMKGVHIGPRINMTWMKDMKEIDESLKKKLKSKKKAAAWFVSHCTTRNKREKYVKSLQKALEPYGFTVDIYGACGALRCHAFKEKCWNMITYDYYFYLSFENDNAEDYVTEKLLTAMNHSAVPIVLGGANYTRFVPPGSYIDARQHEPESLAREMADIIANPSRYHEFFRWRNHYRYSKSEQVEDVCNLCTALNNENMMKESTYPRFRSWWNPDWEERCLDSNWYT